MVDVSVKKIIESRSAPDSIPARIKAFRKRLKMDQTVLAENLGVSQGTISEWEKGDHPPSPMALMAIGRLDEDAMWWYEQAGPRFAESLKTGRLIQEVRAERKEGKATDPELLARVLEAVDAAMNLKGGFFPTKIRAGVIAAVYDDWQKTGLRDSAIIIRLLNEALHPSNRKVRT